MIYSRSDWGAAPPKSPPTPGDPADSLVVHHTGGGAAPWSAADAMAMLRGIQASHQAGEYSDIAYNMAVDQFGNAYILRGMDVLGGATYGANDHTRAVVWLGNSDVETPSDAALRAIAALYRAEVGRNLTADATITGHRDCTATGCPGETLYGQLDLVRRYAGEQPQEDDDMMRSMTTPAGTVLLVDRLSYRVMPGTWAEVEAALRGMIAAGTVAGNPDGSPRLWPITDAGVRALVQV